MPPLTKFQKIQQRRQGNALAPKVTAPVTTPLPTVTPTPIVTPPVRNLNQNFGMWSAEGGAVKPKPTLATRDNPMISVSTVPTPVDINTADQNTLLKEQDAINYKISTGNFTQDDFVRGREISRKLAESLYKAPEQVDNPYLTQLEQQAKSIQGRDNNPLVEARRAQLQANLDTRRAQLEENARRARESTIGNIAMAGGGRSSVAQQAELDIQKELQNQLNAEEQAMNLEIMAYERELAGADSEELAGINQSINALRTQAAQGQQALEAQSQGKIQESVARFDSNLQSLARSRGIELDVNDEKAIEQFVSIARNPDGTVNENFVKTLAPQYQELVRAGVWSGIGRMNFTPKIERLWGTTKAPIYWYRDPNKWQFVTTNAMGVPTGWVRTWGGWWSYSWWWGATWVWTLSQWWGTVYDDLLSVDPWKFKNIDQSKNYWFATNAILANEEIKWTQDYINWLNKYEWTAYSKLPNILKPDEIRKMEQAQENYVNAVLRQESWAAIPDSEMNKYIKQYFPQPWDSAALIKQKEQNRIIKANSLVEASWKSDILRPILNKTTQPKNSTTNPKVQVKTTTWAWRWNKK